MSKSQNSLDNFCQTTPTHLYRLTWRDRNNNQEEYWSESYKKAMDKKFEIDHDETLIFEVFESWFAYEYSQHEKLTNK